MSHLDRPCPPSERVTGRKFLRMLMYPAALSPCRRCLSRAAVLAARGARKPAVDDALPTFREPLFWCVGQRSLSSQPATVAPGAPTEQGATGNNDGMGSVEGARPRVEMRPWDPSERRTGALAMKVGMVPLYDSWGIRHATTVLQLDECEVIQVKTDETDGYTSLQLGVGEKKRKNVTKPLTRHFAKAGVKPKRKLMEFRVSEGALLPPGFRVRAQHFVAGQKVDACGTSKGKGFQGVMKRWGFAGQPASHGVSKTHRHMGSTGQCQDPGKVFKGKKMPGRMGGDRVTVQSLKILKIDPKRDLLFVKGHVPGQNGGYIRVSDAVRGPDFPSDPPFPSFVPGADQETEESQGDIWCPQVEEDPLEIKTDD